MQECCLSHATATAPAPLPYLGRPSGFEFYQFEQGSIGGKSGPAVTNPDWADVQLYGIANQYAFGEFTFDASLDDPEVHYHSVHEDEEIIYEITLIRSDLTPDKTKDPHLPDITRCMDYNYRSAETRIVYRGLRRH